jgi:hypothetical protein
MKHIDTIVNQPVKSQSDAVFTDQEKDSTGYFFVRLKVCYPQQYNSQYPDEITERFAKREYARQFSGIGREKIDSGFNLLHSYRQKDPDGWRFIDVDKIIGLIKYGEFGGIERAGIHKVFPPLLENKTAQEKARKVGADVLANLKAML